MNMNMTQMTFALRFFTYYNIMCDVCVFAGLVNQLRAGGGRWVLQGGAMLVLWLVSLGRKALSRLCLVVGCLIAVREVYGYLIVYARNLSNWFGDMILEPNN